MHERNVLLVVIDPTTKDQPALARATDFAKHAKADLALLACIYDSDIAHVQWVTGEDLGHLRSAAIDEHFVALEKMAETISAQGLDVTFKVVWDNPLHEAIIREAARIEPDFVIKDTHHHSALARALFTNTDWHLIRECPYSLWLVKPGTSSGSATIAAVDPLHEHDQTAALDRRIVQDAQLISAMFEERLHLLHAFEAPPIALGGAFGAPTITPASLVENVVEKARQKHESALFEFAAEIGFPAEQVHLCEGNAADVLPLKARELNASVLVMGAVARSRVDRAIIGSTAERTLENIPCDVVVVKSDEFESTVAGSSAVYGHAEKTGELSGR